jgi:hypothetical protein
MKYGDVEVGEMFFFEDNFAYPKVKLHYGHMDIRDAVTGIMPDNIPVITVSEIHQLVALTAEVERLQRIEQAAIHAYEFITRAQFDFTNGNNVFGVDEGDVIGRRACNELEDELEAALKAAK